MTKFKHDVLIRLVRLIDAVLITVPFAICWFGYYAERIDNPFYSKGSWSVFHFIYHIRAII